MNLVNILKVNFLVIGLAFSCYLIYSLKHDGLPQSVSSMFNLNQNINNGNGQDYITWCDTRARTLMINQEVSLFQKGTRWYKKQNQTESPLQTLAVEKWFSNFCRLKVKFIDSQAKTGQFENKLGIEFVNGIIGYFRKNTINSDRYQWKERQFESQALSQAIEELEEITSN